MRRASEVDVFAEIEPMQKERIILALKKAGNVVGYLGDGINDAPALHAADVGILGRRARWMSRSEAADFVLLEHDLEVLVDGVREGRRTFANTLKYVFIATSANFGNMFSMAGASLFLPFLPLLPKQILLINLLTDFPEMTIAGDNIDPEMVQAPRRWDIKFIRKFMLVFGTLSSVFDCLTFIALISLGATITQFRTAWFIESIVSASLIVLVVRSRRPFFKSRPSKLLVLATATTIVAAFLAAYLPFAALLGFGRMPVRYYGIIGLIVLAYLGAAEVTKHMFYRSSGDAVRAKNISENVRQGMLADLLGIFVATRPLHVDAQLVTGRLQSFQQCLSHSLHHRVSQLRVAREQVTQIRDAKNAHRNAIEGSRAELPLVRLGEPGPSQCFAGPDLLDLHMALARQFVVESDAASLDQVISIGRFPLTNDRFARLELRSLRDSRQCSELLR